MTMFLAPVRSSPHRLVWSIAYPTVLIGAKGIARLVSRARRA